MFDFDFMSHVVLLHHPEKRCVNRAKTLATEIDMNFRQVKAIEGKRRTVGISSDNQVDVSSCLTKK